MLYTHLKKIGNNGDLVKHPLIAVLVKHLCCEVDPSTFTYAETHAGRPTYVLERRGEWEKGIGEFYRKIENFRTISTVPPSLKPFISLFSNQPPRPGSEYPGSSGLVYQMLKQFMRPYRFFLCDVNPSVCIDLMSYFPQWDQVTICRGNGYKLIQNLQNASFVLIDPAYLDSDEDKNSILKTLAVLDAKNIPVMCWTPRVEPSKDSEVDPIYASYEKEVALTFGSLPVKWSEPVPNEFWGCHIAVSKSLEEITRGAADEICKIMEWDS